MSYDPKQFRSIVRSILEEFKLWTPVAEELLLGTCAKESLFGMYFEQVGGGPALGPFQMEPATFRYLRLRFALRFPSIVTRDPGELRTDLRLAILFARLKYLSIPAKLPDLENPDRPTDADVLRLGVYWDRYYNGNPNHGTPEEFLRAYRRFVRG